MAIDLSGLITAKDKAVQALASAKASKRAELEAWFASVTAQAADYPDIERDSWPAQQAEAEAWQADNNADTPVLTNIAAGRGITVAELVPKVLANAAAFVQAATAIGVRQRLRDAIDDASTIEDVEAIGVPH